MVNTGSQKFKRAGALIFFLAAAFLVFFLGFGTGWQTNDSMARSDLNNNAFPIRENNSQYHFIRPLLGFEVGDKTEFFEYFDLERTIWDLINRYQKERKIQSASLYFRNFGTGHWMGINEDEKYSPASLYKVALMISYLKQAESDPALLSRRVIFTSSRQTDQSDYPPMTAGQSYTMGDLIERLIIYSDNDAKDLLHDNLNQSLVDNIFIDLGLDTPKLNDINDSMSAKAYSRFLRVLFGATYLNRDMSEKALALLAKVKFRDGLAGGLPLNLEIAHKFGHRSFTAPVNGVTEELHDCGIIYYPDNPYLLCIMTRGWDINDLSATIKDLSRIVFNEINTEDSLKKSAGNF